MGELRSAVDGVLAQDPHDYADVELGALLEELEREIARLTSAQLSALAVFDARSAYQADGCASSAAWLRSRLRVAPGDAAARVRAARRLRGQREVAAALAEGDISWPHARVLSEQIGRTADRLRLAAGGQVDAVAAVDALVGQAERLLVDAARALDPRDTAKAARGWQHVVDPDGFDRDADAAHQSRFLNVSPTWGGMVRIDGELDAPAGEVVLAAVGALASPDGPDDRRLPGQRRADALVELCHRALDSGALPQSGGERPHVTVQISLDTLEQRLGCPPGELARTGPIPAETARRLACDAGRGCRHRTLGNGTQRSRPGAGIPFTRGGPSPVPRALPALAERPGEGRPGRACRTDAHHIHHWADGGPTSLDNLVLLCRRHHRATHEGHQSAPVPEGRPPPRDDPDPPHHHDPDLSW